MSNKKVYLAVLNGGWLRREFTWDVLPRMRGTKGVTLVWENPRETWANPISSNRNLITLRFLQTDCDYLLMLDNDVIPMFNPLELVYADKDIVGFPAKVRSSGQLIAWTAYIPHSSGEGYSTLDLNAFDDMLDLIPCDIVGTGCILIKRKVLEKLKAPFHVEFDENGVEAYGTDFAFCRKAKANGFKVHTTLQRRCEHFKEVGLLDIEGWDSTSSFDTTNSKYQRAWGGMSITVRDWHFIKGIVEMLQPKRILEFGAGLSSLLLSEIADVVSYDTSEDNIASVFESRHNCIEGIKDAMKKINPAAEAKFNLKDLDIALWDGKECCPSGEYQLAFVDGPAGESLGGEGREQSIRIASEKANHIIVHDAGRPFEQQWQRKHLRGKFKLMARSGEHVTRCHYWVRRKEEVTNDNFKKLLGIDAE